MQTWGNEMANNLLFRNIVTASGYKAFYPDLTSRNGSSLPFRFAIGERFVEQGEPVLCFNGFHFCLNVFNLFKWYPVSFDIRICRVDAFGDYTVSRDGDKACASEILVKEELSPEDIVLALLHDGTAIPGDTQDVLNRLWYSIEGWRMYKCWAGQPWHCDVGEKWLQTRYREYRAVLKERIPKEVRKKCL